MSGNLIFFFRVRFRTFIACSSQGPHLCQLTRNFDFEELEKMNTHTRTHTDTYTHCLLRSASKLFILWVRRMRYFYLTPQCGSHVAHVNSNTDWQVCVSGDSGVAQWGPNPQLLTVTTACLIASLFHSLSHTHTYIYITFGDFWGLHRLTFISWWLTLTWTTTYLILTTGLKINFFPIGFCPQMVKSPQIIWSLVWNTSPKVTSPTPDYALIDIFMLTMDQLPMHSATTIIPFSSWELISIIVLVVQPTAFLFWFSPTAHQTRTSMLTNWSI